MPVIMAAQFYKEIIDERPIPEPAGFKIIAGGQTGADQAGLDWAIAHGHGGWCPKGRKSEDGPIDARYQLQKTTGADYLERTRLNVRDSNANRIFTLTRKLDGGSKKPANLPKTWQSRAAR